ncbi:MAG: NAD/NADP octopine/nopaline dehydrogenase family protein [Pannonibacter phragmitetus]
MSSSFTVAILGAGGIGLASAALLATRGHRPVLWSPSGRGLAELTGSGLEASGAIEGSFRPEVAETLAQAVAGADGILIALPGNPRRAVFEALIPLLEKGQTVIVSADLSLGAAWLQARTPVLLDVATVAMSTTVVMGRRTAPGKVTVGGIRARVEAACLPQGATSATLEFCNQLFGGSVVEAPGGMLAILLGNLNPPVHMANALCNLTRIEKGEAWANYDGITPAVARLIEDLDRERLALAARFGISARTVEAHFSQTFGLPLDMPLAQMTAEIHRRRGGPPGPVSLDTRFLTEDLPFGITPLVHLGRACGQPMPLHEAGLTLLSSACGQDFAGMNDLLEGLEWPGTLDGTAPAV